MTDSLDLVDAGLTSDGVVETALAEDLRYGPDATTAATVPADAVATAELALRKPGVVAGIPVALAVFDTVLGDYEVLDQVADGTRLPGGRPALTVRGPVRGLLTAERTALNLLCHLSGIATATAAWVDAVAGTGCAVRDSRKTLPGLRQLQKYAVRRGGGVNHRLGLGDAVLIKDNHVVAAGSVTAAIAAVREHAPELPCEVEVDTLDRVRRGARAGRRARSCWTTSRPTSAPKRSAGGTPRRPGSNPPAASPSTWPAATPRPASTTWPSAASRTP